MSDPMTNVEIEDVLSSIRRLVSEDTRPPQRPAPDPKKAPGKLVLTPALRVVADAGPAPMAAPARPRSAAPSAATSPFDSVSHEAAAAVLEAALSARGDDWEPDGSEVLPTATPWVVEWEADSPTAPQPALVDADAAPAVQAGIADDDDLGIDWQDDSLPTTLAPAAQSLLADDSDIEETVIDAAALQDLVRDILREELQGPLGELITRKVRKLVRAEINRALAARDLG